MKAIVLAPSGRIASGKTTLSEAVASSLGWPRVAFGDYVRSVARTQRLPESRSALQDLGATLIEEQGWDGFCRSVLAQADRKPGDSLVVDGVRHVEAIAALRPLLAPAELLLVFLKVEPTIREARLARRPRPAEDSLKPVDLHSTEVQLSAILPSLANLTVDGTRPLKDLVPTIVQWLHQRQAS